MVWIKVEYGYNVMRLEDGFRWLLCIVRGLLVDGFKHGVYASTESTIVEPKAVCLLGGQFSTVSVIPHLTLGTLYHFAIRFTFTVAVGGGNRPLDCISYC